MNKNRPAEHGKDNQSQSALTVWICWMSVEEPRPSSTMLR